MQAARRLELLVSRLATGLATRLALTMIGTMLLTLLVLAASQQFAVYRSYQMLPSAVRETVPAPPLLSWSLLLRPFSGGRTGLRLRAEGSDDPLPTNEPDRLARNFQDFRRLQRESLLGGMGVAALLTVALALLLSRVIARPVERVSRAAAGVAEGDLSIRVPLTRVQRRSSLEATQLTENFNRMAEALEGYENERKAMIADIAHELRTPLTAMKLRLQALEDGLVPFSPSEVVRLQRHVDRLTRLVQDLRTLSLADAGRLSLQRRDSDLVALAQTVLEDYKPRAAQKEIALELSAPEHALRASLDADRVAQVIGNLLDNALRVTPEHGLVKVALGATGDSVRLSVSDTGPGLAPDALEHVFDRFFQDKDTQGASGLGLAIVKTLVTLHGGQVKAGNHAAGAQFEVLLPRRVRETTSAPPITVS